MANPGLLAHKYWNHSALIPRFLVVCYLFIFLFWITRAATRGKPLITVLFILLTTALILLEARSFFVCKVQHHLALSRFVLAELTPLLSNYLYKTGFPFLVPCSACPVYLNPTHPLIPSQLKLWFIGTLLAQLSTPHQSPQHCQ